MTGQKTSSMVIFCRHVISALIIFVMAISFVTPGLGQASAAENGRQQSAIWWASVLHFHKQTESYLLDLFRQAEQASGAQKGRTGQAFKKLLLQSTPGARLTLTSSGSLPLQNSTTAYFQNYYRVHRLIQKFPGIVREFNFGQPHRPDITFKDGLNSVSLKINKKDFSSITFTSAHIPAIAPQAAQIARLRPKKITSYKDLITGLVADALPYARPENPLPVLISDYYQLDPQVAGLRIDAFIESLFTDPAARERMLSTMERIYTKAGEHKAQGKGAVSAAPQEKAALFAPGPRNQSNSVDESQERLPAVGFLVFAIMATMAFLRWNDRRSRRRMPRFQKNAGPARKHLHEHEVFRGKVENHKQHDPVAEPDISVDEQGASFWDLDTIRRLPHRQFEILCQRLFEAMGARVEINDGGSPDGGIDLKVFKNGKLEAIVQCKQYPQKKIGVNLIREFFGVMASEKAPKGIFITSGDFTAPAREYAAANKVMLADGAALEKKLRRQNVLRSPKFTLNAPGDIACPLCNAPMVWRESGNFWGCSTFGATRCSGKRFKVAAG